MDEETVEIGRDEVTVDPEEIIEMPVGAEQGEVDGGVELIQIHEGMSVTETALALIKNAETLSQQARFFAQLSRQTLDQARDFLNAVHEQQDDQEGVANE